MNANVVTGVVVVLALLIAGWWYWAFFTPTAVAPSPEESVNDVAVSEENIGQMLSGTWRSDQDPKFVRTLSPDGTATDSYEGMPEATISGHWELVTDLSKEPASLPVVDDTRVLKIEFPEEALYFAVTEASEDHLSLMYLTGNNTLEFSRVK